MPEATAQTVTESTPATQGDPTPGYKPGETPPVTEAAPQESSTETKPEAGKSLVSGKTEETPKGEQEPKTDDKSAEDIQIKLPEGVKVDEKFYGEFKGIAKELGLKSEAAQKLVDLHLGYVERLSKEFADNATKQNDEWFKSIETDKDIGGSKIKETSLSIHAAVQKFGGDEFRKEIDAAGLGNWPPLVRFLHKVGVSLKDDTTRVDEKPASTPANDEEAYLKGLYPNTPQMFPQK